jgi:hypothetical protein
MEDLMPPPWEPSDKILIQMRQLNRRGASVGEIHAAVNPPIGLESFRATLKRFGISPQPTRRAHAGTSELKVPPGGHK